jgi:hypothetical protein
MPGNRFASPNLSVSIHLHTRKELTHSSFQHTHTHTELGGIDCCQSEERDHRSVRERATKVLSPKMRDFYSLGFNHLSVLVCSGPTTTSGMHSFKLCNGEEIILATALEAEAMAWVSRIQVRLSSQPTRRPNSAVLAYAHRLPHVQDLISVCG